MAAKERNSALDGLRGFAMLLIFLWHCTFLAPETAADKLFLGVLHYSWIGMHMFFALSGLLITGILLDSKDDPAYFKNFYARRFLRIFPLYYLVLAVAFFVLPHFQHSKSEQFAQIAGEEWAYWLYLSNFTIAKAGLWRHSIVDVSWSLAIEEQFYIVWPLVVYLLSPRRLTVVAYATIALSLAMRVYLTLKGGHTMEVYVSTLTRCDAIAAGALVPLVMRVRGRWHDFLLEHRMKALLISGAAMYGVLAVEGGNYDMPLIMTAGHGLVAVFSGLLLLNLAHPGDATWLTRAFNWPLFQVVGRYSYGIYLFHLPLRALLRDAVYPPASFHRLLGSALPGQLLFYLVSGVVVLAAAALSYHLFESKWLSLQKYFRYAPAKSIS